MDSVVNIAADFCNWRNRIEKGDNLQVWDGKSWCAATVYDLKSTQDRIDQVFICFDNYSSKYDRWYARQSRNLRPTIGLLRRKIMVPQAQRIQMLQNKILSMRNSDRRVKDENRMLRDKLHEMEQKYEVMVNAYNDQQRFKSMSSTSVQSVSSPSLPQRELEHRSPIEASQKQPIAEGIRKRFSQNKPGLDEIDESRESKRECPADVDEDMKLGEVDMTPGAQTTVISKGPEEKFQEVSVQKSGSQPPTQQTAHVEVEDDIKMVSGSLTPRKRKRQRSRRKNKSRKTPALQTPSEVGVSDQDSNCKGQTLDVDTTSTSRAEDEGIEDEDESDMIDID